MNNNSTLVHRYSRYLLAGCLGTLMLTQPLLATARYSPAQLQERTYERRAVEAAIWGMPLVSFDSMRQAYYRDAGAKNNDILFWSAQSDWRNQLTTPNHSTLYVMFFVNLKDGPVVVDVPPTREADLYGSLLTAWQVPLVNVGSKGKDAGQGGRYLLLPPGYKEAIPEGYIAVPSDTINAYSLLRVITPTQSPADMAKGVDYLKQLKVYPLAKAQAPDASRFIDLAGKSFEGLANFNASFYTALARMVTEEPVHDQDMAVMGQLRSLSIGKQLNFTPDPAQQAILGRAASEAHSYLMEGFADAGAEVWGGQRKWQWMADPRLLIGTRLNYRQPGQSLRIDERGFVFFAAFAPPQLADESERQVVYMKSYKADSGEALLGDHTYRLRIPAEVPASQFWAADVYDAATGGFIRKSQVVGLDSYANNLKKNADGTIDLYFAPKAPAGQESNWISTQAGKPYFTVFRLYGPQQSILDRSWVLNDLQRVN